MIKMQDPDASYRPAVTLNFEDRYRARLEEVEERESTQPGARKGDTYLLYKFSLHDPDGAPVIDDNSGDPYLQFHSCNTSTGYSKPPFIGSREIAEALLGKKLDSDEVRELIDQGWEEPLVNRTCMIDMQLFKDEKTGNERIRIVRIMPDRKRAAARSAAADFEAEAQARAASAPKAAQNGRQAAPEPEEAPEFVDPQPAPRATETREERRERLLREMQALEEADV